MINRVKEIREYCLLAIDVLCRIQKTRMLCQLTNAVNTHVAVLNMLEAQPHSGICQQAVNLCH